MKRLELIDYGTGIIAVQKLFKKDNGVVALYAVDAVNCGTAMSRYDAKQEKEKQERDDAMRRNAIEAL